MRLPLLCVAACLAVPLSTPFAAGADPFAKAIGGPFALIDHTGQPRTQTDPDGHWQLLFFGYANCPDICTAALPLMAEMVDRLDGLGHKVRPLMITVDPEVDTPQTMGPPMTAIHPRFLGLSGDKAALAQSYAAFNVDIEPLFTAPDGQTIFAHGSFIYLLAPDGAFQTLIPPILGPDEAARIAQGYIESPKSADGT